MVRLPECDWKTKLKESKTQNKTHLCFVGLVADALYGDDEDDERDNDLFLEIYDAGNVSVVRTNLAR